MAGKRKRPPLSKHRPPSPKPAEPVFYTPFVGLDQQLSRKSPPLPPSPASPPEGDEPRPSEAPEREQERLFREAMADVVPMDRTQGTRIPPVPPPGNPPRFLAREDLEVYTYLVDLVTGEAAFELTLSDEYIDGALVGLSPDILGKLRKGEFSYQDYIDLHGYKREQARERVTRFLLESFAKKLRCVLVVSGRGLNSRDKQPVLKKGLVSWLTRAPLKRVVLAFASARSHDGGAGAFYVLLRRNPGKGPVVSPAP